MKIFVYRTFDSAGDIICQGVIDHSEDVSIEEVTTLDTTSDRDLHDVQDFIERHYPEYDMHFEWQEMQILPRWEIPGEIKRS